MKVILIDAVHTLVRKRNGEHEIFKEMQDLLDIFPNEKIILTGATDEQIKEFCLDKIPYRLFTLGHNPEKTDPKYYEFMLKHFFLNKDDVVYIEHKLEAVKSAKSIGIKTYYYDAAKQDLEALKKFLAEDLKTK